MGKSSLTEWSDLLLGHETRGVLVAEHSDRMTWRFLWYP
jgi:hypothetical protein